MAIAKFQQWSPGWQAASLLLTLLPLYYLSYRLHPTYSGSTKPTWSHDDFRDQWLKTHLLVPFNPFAIQAYCNQTQWRPNLVFNLPDANGGIGNVRAEVLDFLFYAIEAGASIVMPGMAVRREEELFDVWGAGRANFSRMFDEEWFRKSMSIACPQMRSYDPEDDNIHAATKIDSFYWPDTPLARRHQDRPSWLKQTNSWLQDHGVNDSQLTVVSLERTMWQTDTRGLPPAVRLNLPMTVRINPDIRRYAGIAMANLATQHDVRMIPTDQVHEHAFYGAHLRTESDTVTAGWFNSLESGSREMGMNWTAQTDAYIDAAVKHRLHTIFAASGNATELDRFKEKAAAHRPALVVLTKWDLLSIEEATELKKYHWDQQALVDMEILMRCSVFGGFAKSSFAFMIAVARTAWMEQKGMVQDPWFAPHVDVGVAFDNGLNKMWGRNQLNEERIPRSAWP